jgi:hypothetical protein
VPARGIEGILSLFPVFQRLIGWQRAFNRIALDVLHHQIVGSDIVELADVPMIQGRHGTVFALEAIRELVCPTS